MRISVTEGGFMRPMVFGIMVLVVGILLGGCAFLSKEHFSQSPTQYIPMAENLSDSQKAEYKAQALAHPATKEIRARLEAKGYALQEDPVVTLQFERGFVVIFRAVEAQPSQNPREPPAKPLPPRREPQPKLPATLGAGPACLVYLGLEVGSRAFGVIDQAEQDRTLHIYLDGERVFRQAGNIIDQLRKNERFRKFEEWLRSYGKVAGAAEAIVDEATHEIYILIYVAQKARHGDPRGPWVWTMALNPNVEVYMALANARTIAGNEVTLDVDTLVLLPAAKTEGNFGPGFPVRETCAEVSLVGGPVYTVIGGGEKPREFQHLRDFAFFTGMPTGEELHTVPSRSSPEAGLRAARSLTLFGWNLVNVPADNVLLQFKTDAELTLAAYNAAVKQGAYGVIAAKDTRSTSALPVYLAGFIDLRLEDIKELYTKALHETSSDQPYIVVPVEGVIHGVEHRLKMPLERVGELLLELAEAERQGRFDEVYQKLLPQGLGNLVEVFSALIPEGWPGLERIPRFIKSLSLEWQRRLLEKRITPQGIREVILNKALETLLDLLWNAFISFVQGDTVPAFVRVFCYDNGYFEIRPKDFIELGAHWGLILRPWLDSWLDDVDVDFPKLRGLQDAADWKKHFSRWGGRLGDPRTRKEAVVIVSVIYTYMSFERKIPRWEVDVKFKPYYHHLLKLMAFLDDALILDDPHKWICAGISVPNATEARLVLYREEKRRGVQVKDIAVVNFTAVPDSAEGFEKIYNWLDSAIKTFTEGREYNPWDHIRYGTNRWEAEGRGLQPGFDIAAVVFTDPVSSERATEIRKLVDRMAKDLPWTTEHGYHLKNPDNVAARAVVVAWKEEDETGNVINWVSIIELGPGKISKEEKDRLARVFAGDNPKIYDPNSTSSSSQSRSSNPTTNPVIITGGMWCRHEFPDRPLPLSIP